MPPNGGPRWHEARLGVKNTSLRDTSESLGRLITPLLTETSRNRNDNLAVHLLVGIERNDW